VTWSWSHTQEAYDNARRNVASLDRETLEVIWSEIQTYRKMLYESGIDAPRSTLFDTTIYQEFRQDSRDMSRGQLADYIWNFMEQDRRCSNGGHRAYCCPYGCGPHRVSFD